MTSQELAARIEQLQPMAMPRDVARLSLLLLNSVDDADALRDDDALIDAWTGVSLRLQSLTDQHCAMTEELETLADANPETLGGEDVLRLLRAIKVQSHVLDLYVGQPTEA
jgi:hypothetical protein